MSAPHAGDTINDIEGGDEAAETLTALIKAAFPHQGVPDSAYRRAAATVQAAAEDTTWMRVKLTQGLDSLQALAGGSFTELTAQEALPLLLRVQHLLLLLLCCCCRLQQIPCLLSKARRSRRRRQRADLNWAFFIWVLHLQLLQRLLLLLLLLQQRVAGCC